MTPKEAFVKTFLEGIDQILPGNKLHPLYTEYFDGLSATAMEALVVAIEKEEMILPIIVPNLHAEKIKVERNLKLAEKWGHKFYQHLTLTDPTDPSVTIQTPEKYLVVDLITRRQAQTLEDKMSIPKDNTHVDDLSGQVTGESKGSAISKPESHVLDFHGLDATLTELMKPRGGDMEAWNTMSQSIMETGVAKLSEVTDAGTHAKSAETLETWLKVAHIGNNITTG